ncbi:MAG: ankyrin repeat domain-containing protein [Candidatus Omnitrophica bacterium]|nr:ankyrin repeat domain-containing protein [Candidatus Omnitrophota bacterium]MBU1996604.1 ankyrin repeat domain-containing protein [Candidatus Omnitrophota bacterium]
MNKNIKKLLLILFVAAIILSGSPFLNNANATLIDQGEPLREVTDNDQVLIGDFLKAVGKRDIDAVKRILQNSIDVNASIDGGPNALLIASSNGNIEIVKMLINSGADVNFQPPNGVFALFYAARKGHSEIVTMLLEKGAEINLTTALGTSALMAASENGHRSIARTLIEKNADLNLKDGDGWTALMFALINGRKDIMKMLIEKGADINLKDNKGMNALLIASDQGDTDIVKMLIEKGADLNEKNNDGNPALDLAKQRMKTDVVKMVEAAGKKSAASQSLKVAGSSLIEQRVPPVVVFDSTADTENIKAANAALIMASLKGNIEDIKSAIDQGADLNCKHWVIPGSIPTTNMLDSSNDYTALIMAVGNGHFEAVKVLIASGADVNSVLNTNQTSLHWASRISDMEIFKFLLENKADPDIGNVLNLVSENGQTDFVKVLISAGATVDAADRSGNTALMIASEGLGADHIAFNTPDGKGNVEIVKLLISNGADVNKKNGEGETPLIKAAKFGESFLNSAILEYRSEHLSDQVEIMKILIENNADVNAVDKNGISPLSAAKYINNIAAVKLLEDSGAN